MYQREAVAGKENTGSKTTASSGVFCPKCGGIASPIVYGAPTPPMLPMFLDQRITAGGAMRRLLPGDAPEWRCLGCEYKWRGGLFTGGPGDSFGDAVVINGIASTAVGVRAEK